MQQTHEKRETKYDIDPIFLKRWSSRAFSRQQVPEEIWKSVLEAARWAPSAKNIQPWRFIIAKRKEDLEKFHSFILPGNLTWAKEAPVLMILISEKAVMNGQDKSMAFDAGTAWGYLSLEAARKGLVSHAMGGIDKEKARDVLNIPENFDIHIAVALGYPGNKADLPEDLQQREQPSSRKAFNEIVTEGCFSTDFHA